MNFFQVLFGDKKSRTWFIVAVSVIAFLLVLTILAETLLFTLFVSILGGRSNVKGEGAYFYSDYETKEEVLAAGNELNERINEEGITMLKNEGNALPLTAGAKLSVFGRNSVQLVYGGSGSGGGNNADALTLKEGLEAAGFQVNPTLDSFYNDSSKSGPGRGNNPAIESGVMTGRSTGETPLASYTDEVKASYAQYSDAALVVISRIGGEGFDLPRTMYKSNNDKTKVDGAYDAYDHYLELDKNEQDMLQHVCENFDKVILIVNSSTSLELGFLDALADNDSTVNNYDYASKIQGALWIGGPGNVGIKALGKVLKGEVNPSGRTIDTYSRDFTQDPTYKNFSTNLSADGDQYLVGGTAQTAWFVDYEEGIYVGYRYYETRGHIEGETWYDSHVVFPFGYGLSYTTFDWEVVAQSPAQGSAITTATEFSITVRVTNTGSVSGKDVVQAYLTAPYTAGGIEKSHVALVGFEKTGEIQPGAHEDVVITFEAYDLASYDYDDANNNGFSGYELEAGNYTISIRKNAHDEIATTSYVVSGSGEKWEKDPVTDYDVVNRYADADDELGSVLSRADFEGTWPETRTTAERTVTAAFVSGITNDKASGNPLETATNVPMPNQAPAKLPTCEVQLYDLISIVGDKMVVDYDNPLWDTLLDQLTVDQMYNLIKVSAFNTPGIPTISKPATTEADGPVGFVIFMGDPTIHDTVVYASECVIAATWNVDLAEAMGTMVGNEGIIGDNPQKGSGNSYSGWYAPALNIHRTPFSGRNFEYYSEDGFFSGKMAAAVVRGAESKGVYPFMKHFAINDQETHRTGVCTWINEQTMREVYLKAFEIAVKEGGATGVMSSFNRIGTKWAGGDYRLLTEILRNEWGFRGTVICDFNTESYMNVRQMIYAGGDLNLATIAPAGTIYDKTNAADVTVIRQSAKNILFTVCESLAMNGLGEGITLKIKLASWEYILIVVDCLAVVGMAAWGYFAISGALKRQKAGPVEEPEAKPEEKSEE